VDFLDRFSSFDTRADKKEFFQWHDEYLISVINAVGKTIHNYPLLHFLIQVSGFSTSAIELVIYM